MNRAKKIWQNMTKKQKITWSIVCTFLVLGTVLYLANPSEYYKTPEVNKPASSSTSNQEPPKTGFTYTTSSGLTYKIKKITTLNLGVSDNRKQTKFFNLDTTISKDGDWHNQAKEIITDIVKRNNGESIAVNITSADNTDILNWNMQLTNTILYTYPVEANESEVFEVK